MRAVLPGLVAGSMLVAATPALAQSDTSTARTQAIQDIRAEIARLTARLDKLEKEDPAAPVAATPLPPPPGTPPEKPAPVAVAEAPTYSVPTDLRSPGLDAAAIERRAVAPATLDRSLQSSGFGFQLSASTDATNVAVKFGRDRSTSTDTRGIYTSLAATISAPLSTSGSQSDIGTLDGFVNSSKLKLSFSRYSRPISEPIDAPGFDALVAGGRRQCRLKLGEKASECATQAISTQWFHTYAPSLETAFLGMGHMTSGPNPRVDWSAFAIGAEASVGYKNYKYILGGPARGADVDRVPFGAKVFVSYLPDVRYSAITGGVEFQRTYKEATAGALCPVAVAGAETKCLTGPLGLPTRNDKLLLSAEYRYRWVFKEDSFIPILGISGQLSYDALNDDFGIDVPVYLAADPKNGLTGGIRFGYRTKDSGFVAGVFVGSTFGNK